MDPKHFDAMSRTVANGFSRRQAVARWGAAGVLAGLAAAVGRDRVEAARPAVQAETCSLAIVANVRLGPSVGALLQGTTPGELRGDISFALGPDGRIDGGRWRLSTGAELPVVGQATGRALNLRVQAGIGQAIVLVGAAEQDLSQCTGAVDGLLTGPQLGDLGDFHAIATALGGAGDTSPATATGTATGTTSPAPAAPTATPAPAPGAPTATAPASATATLTPAATETATATPTPTPTPTATPTPTPEVCPGATDCGGACVDLQTNPANCGACGNACSLICSGGQCIFLQACLSPQVFCGDRCVDLQTDPANCGACGATCGIIETCFGGECQPPEAELAP